MIKDETRMSRINPVFSEEEEEDEDNVPLAKRFRPAVVSPPMAPVGEPSVIIPKSFMEKGVGEKKATVEAAKQEGKQTENKYTYENDDNHDDDDDDDVPLALRMSKIKEALVVKPKFETKPKEMSQVMIKKEKIMSDVKATVVSKTKLEKGNGKHSAENFNVKVKVERKSLEVKIKQDVKIIDKSKDIVKKEIKHEKVKKDEMGEDNGEEGEGEFKWWEVTSWDNTIKWEVLEHNGPLFPPPYQPHGVKMLYGGKEVYLEPEGEEVASFFAAMLHTDHAQNPIFVSNFFDDFQQVLIDSNSKYAKLITEFEKCDFTHMSRYFEDQREAKKAMSKEEKMALKEEKKKLDDYYGFCMMNGRKEKVGNFRIEPPGLFRGRGKHPRAGKLKLRVQPEQVTINISASAKVPSPPKGHQWGNIVNDNTVTWLATWVENINKAQKYVYLAPGSSVKGQSDLKKFETARKLKDHVERIRSMNAAELRAKEMLVRQRATALWLIDRLALRAGNEKGDDEADTVGCCSLRLEHVKLETPNFVIFDFLGKDSIRYYNRVVVEPIIFKNLTIFMRPPKTASDPIFDRLTTTSLNKYLTGLMEGLTAKVFRTFNASITFQEELRKTVSDATIPEKVIAYNRANREVAVLCNHQKAVAKTFEQSMSKLKDKLLTIKYERYLVKQELIKLVGKLELKKELPAALEPESELDEEIIELKAKEAEEKIRVKKEAKEEVLSQSPGGNSNSSSPRKMRNTNSASRERLEKRLEQLTTRLNTAKLQMIDRNENKTTSLGTSKTNYIDPRITSAWCKKYGVPIEKMFTKTLREKFKWAMDVSDGWNF